MRSWISVGLFMGLFLSISMGCALLEGAKPETPSPAATQPTVAAETGAAPTDTVPPATDTPGEPTPLPTVGVTPVSPEEAIPHLSAGQDVTITTIQMIDAAEGWAIAEGAGIGDHVLRTSDEVYKSTTGVFLDADTAWVAYAPESVVWRTLDGGLTWQGGVIGSESYSGSMMHFMDNDHGWLLQILDAGMNHVYVSFFRTTDGSVTWDKLWDPFESIDIQSFAKTGISFADAQTGWVSRDNRGVMAGAAIDWTHDGGLTFQSQELPPPADAPTLFDDYFCGLYSPHLFSPLSGALVMDCVRFEAGTDIHNAYMYTTDDGGQTWTAQPFPGGTLLFIDNAAWALSREIHESLDGGATWTKVKMVNWDGQFSFVDAELAWAVARAGDEIALVKTSDGCQTWEQLEPLVAP
jgi:photosystem II stability/assembly factor-like uncharacterized protein